MAAPKSYCISANSKYSRSVEKANGELGRHGIVQVMGDNYIVVRADLSDPFVKHVVEEHFHVNDDLSIDVEAYEV